MSFIRRTVYKYYDTTSVSACQAFLGDVKDAIVDANSDWSGTVTVFDTSYVALVMTHTDGAQLCFVMSTSDNPVRSENAYLDTALTADDMAVAFCPSSGGTWPAITNSNNPKDLATFCSGAGSYRFARVEGDHRGLYWHYEILVHDASACLVFVRHIEDATVLRAIIAADDTAASVNFEDINESSQSSFFVVTGLDGSVIAKTGGTSENSAKIAFRSSSVPDLLVENAQLRARDSNLAYYNCDPGPAADNFFEVMTMLAAVDDNWTYGVKGTISPEIMAAVRDDMQFNVPLRIEGKRVLHTAYGTCVGWVSGGVLL